MPEFLSIELMDWLAFKDLVIRVTFNLAVVLYLVRYLYYKTTPRKDYLFSYILVSQIIFFILFLLQDVMLGMGFALGLFAIFGIIRFRTLQVPVREMTYLFVVIGITVVNALSNRKVSYSELLLTNVIVIVLTHLLERVFLLKSEIKKEVVYDRVDLIKPERRQELIQDLEERTGLKINKVEIGRIDYLRDTARVFIFYFERKDWAHSTEDFGGGEEDGE